MLVNLLPPYLMRRYLIIQIQVQADNLRFVRKHMAAFPPYARFEAIHLAKRDCLIDTLRQWNKLNPLRPILSHLEIVEKFETQLASLGLKNERLTPVSPSWENSDIAFLCRD